MFERRLFFHVDWLLLGAVLLLVRHRPGDDLQHDLRHAHLPGGGHAGAAVLGPALRRSASASSRCSSVLALDYRFLAEHSLFLYGGLLVLLIFVLVERRAGRRVDALDPARRLQPAALGVRQARRWR